jgi:HSP20 family molecular chaperone IbpA
MNHIKIILISAFSALMGGVAVLLALRIFLGIDLNFNTSRADERIEDSERLYDDVLKQQNSVRKQFNNFFNDDFFKQSNPFEEMKRMRQQMEERISQMERGQPLLTDPFDSWFSDKFGGGSVYDITKREDDQFVYYDIKVSEVESTSINTKIENGYITITGTQEEQKLSVDENEDDGLTSRSYLKSTFERTLPLPENVDPNRMELKSEENKIVVKFPKLKS